MVLLAAAARRGRKAPMAKDESMFVFDLDACCWSPEMYELWGGGAPFTQVSSAAFESIAL